MNYFDNDEYRAIENLAWMVKNSKQNVGLRMLDAADSVIQILKSKKSENKHSVADYPQTSKTP